MSLLDVLRAGVKVADNVTRPIQPSVTYQRLTTPNADPRGYASAVTLKAIVEEKAISMPTPAGIVSATRTTVLFLNVEALVAATGGQGIKEQDLVTLPDGRKMTVTTVGGFIDAGLGKPVAVEATLE